MIPLYRPCCVACGFEDAAVFTGRQLDTRDFRCPECADGGRIQFRRETMNVNAEALMSALVQTAPPFGRAEGDINWRVWAEDVARTLRGAAMEHTDPSPECTKTARPADFYPQPRQPPPAYEQQLEAELAEFRKRRIDPLMYDEALARIGQLRVLLQRAIGVMTASRVGQIGPDRVFTPQIDMRFVDELRDALREEVGEK